LQINAGNVADGADAKSPSQRNPNAWLEGPDLSAAYALKTARALGIRVCLDGDDLELEASLPPPEWLPFRKEPIVISVRTKSN